MPDPTTTFDTATPLTKIQSLMDAVLKAPLASPPATSLVKQGAPETFPTTVAGYVTVGGHRLDDQTYPGVLIRSQDYFGAFGYRVKGAEAAAEAAIAAAADELARRFYVARKEESGLFETAVTQVHRGSLDANLASAPEYQPYGSVEYRIWPFLITVEQRTTVTILTQELADE